MPLLSKDAPVKRSLILAGGGVRLAYHAGVLQALEEEAGISFNHVDGTSGGIFGTAMLASGVTTMEAANRWRKLKLRGFMGMVPLKSFNPGKLGNGAEGIRKAIYPALGIDVSRINSNTSFDATFNVCNYSTKVVESIPSASVTVDHLIAGMSLPMFMPATQIGKDWYTDAVWIKDANLKEAVARRAEEIWLVWCIGNTRNYHKGYFPEYVHMIEISANAGLFWELEEIKRENQERKKRGERPVLLHIVKPEYPLPLDPDFFLKKIDADTLISMGYADTRAYLKKQIPFDFSELTVATAMTEPMASLHFRQQFNGFAEWNGKGQKLQIRLGVFLRKTEGAYALQCFSSVEEEVGRVTSGFDNALRKVSPGKLEATFSIKGAESNYRINIEMCLTSAIDMMLGLDIQESQITITDTKGVSGYTFYQPANNRIQNALHLSVIGAMKPLKRWKTKWQMLQYLLH